MSSFSVKKIRMSEVALTTILLGTTFTLDTMELIFVIAGAIVCALWIRRNKLCMFQSPMLSGGGAY